MLKAAHNNAIHLSRRQEYRFVPVALSGQVMASVALTLSAIVRNDAEVA
jgi:hypothetical protein